MSVKYIAFKPGVRISRVTPELTTMLQAALDTALHLVDDTVVVTSINDSNHANYSSHHWNGAIDIRTHPESATVTRTGAINADNLGVDIWAELWVRRLQNALGIDYNVLYEPSKLHIHIECDRDRG